MRGSYLRSEPARRFEVQAVFEVQGCEVQGYELRGLRSRVCAVQSVGLRVGGLGVVFIQGFIQGVFKVYAGCMQGFFMKGLFRVDAGCMQGVCRVYSGCRKNLLLPLELLPL